MTSEQPTIVIHGVTFTAPAPGLLSQAEVRQRLGAMVRSYTKLKAERDAALVSIDTVSRVTAIAADITSESLRVCSDEVSGAHDEQRHERYLRLDHWTATMLERLATIGAALPEDDPSHSVVQSLTKSLVSLAELAHERQGRGRIDATPDTGSPGSLASTANIWADLQGASTEAAVNDGETGTLDAPDDHGTLVTVQPVRTFAQLSQLQALMQQAEVGKSTVLEFRMASDQADFFFTSDDRPTLTSALTQLFPGAKVTRSAGRLALHLASEHA